MHACMMNAVTPCLTIEQWSLHASHCTRCAVDVSTHIITQSEFHTTRKQPLFGNPSMGDKVCMVGGQLQDYPK